MKCEYCFKDVEVWFVWDDKWCCKECKTKFLRESDSKDLNSMMYKI